MRIGRFLRETGLMNEGERLDRYIRPGSKVRYDGLDEGGPEYGIIIHCWYDDELSGYDCYVAFFGSKLPSGKPGEKPYVLRYYASSLTMIDP